MNLKILSVVLLSVLALFSATAQAATQKPKIDEYSVHSTEISLTSDKTGLAGTKLCVSKLTQILRHAGVSVQNAQTIGDTKESIGIILGNYQARLIVSGTCLSGGKNAVISVVNPFENKPAPELMKKIRTQ